MRRFATDRYVPEPDPRYWRRVLGVIALVMVALAVWSWAGPQFRRAMHAPEVVVYADDKWLTWHDPLRNTTVNEPSESQ